MLSTLLGVSLSPSSSTQADEQCLPGALCSCVPHSVFSRSPTDGQNVGQIVTFTHISWFTDKFGRKPAFYLAWIWLVVVSQTH